MTDKALSARDNTRRNLMLASLPHVSFDGWTDQAMALGARDASLPVEDIRRYFPQGARQMVQEFSQWADNEMIAALAAQDVSSLRFRDRVAVAVKCRFDILEPHREAVRRSVAFLALPGNVGLGARALYRTVDAIWRALGDRSSDFSFYSKRALLAGVLSTTTIFWLDDVSDNHADTAAFLDRRIGDVMKIQTVRSGGEKLFSHLPDPFRVLRSLRDHMPVPPRG